MLLNIRLWTFMVKVNLEKTLWTHEIYKNVVFHFIFNRDNLCWKTLVPLWTLTYTAHFVTFVSFIISPPFWLINSTCIVPNLWFNFNYMPFSTFGFWASLMGLFKTNAGCSYCCILVSMRRSFICQSCEFIKHLTTGWGKGSIAWLARTRVSTNRHDINADLKEKINNIWQIAV